jgi:virginiamycin B lyase
MVKKLRLNGPAVGVGLALVLSLAFSMFWHALAETSAIREYPVPAGSHPHDVAPAPDGTVWYVAKNVGELGQLDSGTGRIERTKLGEKSRPHGVIVGPDGAPWITDGGLNAIVRVDPVTKAVRVFPLPHARRSLRNPQ